MGVVIRMPEVATGSAEAAIQSWLVDVGQQVSSGQAIVEIETEKAVIEYEAEHDGVLAGILLDAGEAAAVGVPIAVLATDGESAEHALAAERGNTESDAEPTTVPVSNDTPPAPPSATAPPAAEAPARAERRFASPLVRRLARERGIDLDQINGSGPNGRIVRRDLDHRESDHGETDHNETATLPESSAETAAQALVSDLGFEDIPHTGMRRAIARRLTESKSSVPHFYLTADCRMDALLQLRSNVNESTTNKISVNDFIVKAVAGALREVPAANAIWTDEATRRFDGADIAVAVAVPSGLLTPVIRNVDSLSLSDLNASVKDLATRAREGKLKQRELEGGSFTVSNLGMYGVQQFGAIINPPHAGILAVGAASPRPVVDADGSLSVATVMTVTLSADHRVLDGALAAQWLTAFVSRIENPLSILI